jgi:hypothetical protein
MLMTFSEYYIFFGISSLALLTTFSLRILFNKSYEKAGLILLYIVLISTLIFDINKWNLFWLSPLCFVVPYYLIKIKDLIFSINLLFTLRYIFSLFL